MQAAARNTNSICPTSPSPDSLTKALLSSKSLEIAQKHHLACPTKGCQYVFTRKGELDKHMEEWKHIRCPTCEKVFKSEGYLSRHRNKGKCLQSGYALFPSKDPFGRSSPTIARIRPYCRHEGCARQSFGTRFEQNQHDRNVHGRFLCRYKGCTKGSFESEVRRDVHERTSAYMPCEKCGLTLSKRTDLAQHHARK